MKILQIIIVTKLEIVRYIIYTFKEDFVDQKCYVYKYCGN